MNKNTSWGEVADWYNELISNNDDSYQKNVLLPNLLRLVEPKPGQKIADIACGQGYFSFAMAEKGSEIIACDISEELIGIAKKSLENRPGLKNLINFYPTSSNNLKDIADGSIDVIMINLALQNIEDVNGTIKEFKRIIKSDGRIYIVLNHPAFRIPNRSSWHFDEKTGKQSRTIEGYMSESKTEIDMNPSQKENSKKNFTISFHRPLQFYFKLFSKYGLSVSRLEEWISHKASEPGPRSAEENRIRKEIPMFMCLEVKRFE